MSAVLYGKNRKHFPRKLRVNAKRKQNILVRSQYRLATDCEFTAGLWHDILGVTFLSTTHSASIEVVEKLLKRR